MDYNLFEIAVTNWNFFKIYFNINGPIRKIY